MLKELTPEQQARADKVAIMKAKAKGTGGIPPGELMFVFVSLESGAREPTMVSKTWSIGKCVDVIAAQHKIENNNAKIDAKVTATNNRKNWALQRPVFQATSYENTNVYARLSYDSENLEDTSVQT